MMGKPEHPMRLLEQVAELEAENRRLHADHAEAVAAAVEVMRRLQDSPPSKPPREAPAWALWLGVIALVAMTLSGTEFVTARLLGNFGPPALVDLPHGDL